MSNFEDFLYICGNIFFILTIVAILNAVYFQIRYQKKADTIISGDNYIDGGWIFNSTRLMMYAHYCLFPARAERAGVKDRVAKLPSMLKFHLILHWCLVILGSLCMAVWAIADYFF